jgi:putative SOS response-associated peptidase YedK
MGATNGQITGSIEQRCAALPGRTNGAAPRWERTSCIITVEANDLVRKIRDRMPAIIDATHHQRWFDGGEDLLEPYPAEKMGVVPA